MVLGAAAVLVLVLSCSPASAQPVGPDAALTDLLQWKPEHQGIADKLSTGIVVAAVALPCVIDRSWQCARNETIRVLPAVLLSEVTKRLVHRDRPNHHDRLSFPSEHTMVACAAVLGDDSRESLGRKLLWSACPSVAYLRIASLWHHPSDTAASVITAAFLVQLRW